MEEGKKKIIMVIIIVVCLVAAGVITYSTHQAKKGEGINAIQPGTATLWIKCRNPDCEYTYQMDKRKYFDYIEEHRVGMEVPPIVCPKCGEESCYRAIKCASCGLIFERGSVPGDIADRCPKCGHSETEDSRKRRREARDEE